MVTISGGKCVHLRLLRIAVPNITDENGVLTAAPVIRNLMINVGSVRVQSTLKKKIDLDSS